MRILSKKKMSVTTPTPPAGQPETYTPRRKFVVKKPAVGRMKHVKLSAVQQALEEDSTAVETLKRDVADFQQLELETSRRYLVSLQKTYDKLKSEADGREQQQKKYQEDLAAMDRACTEARREQLNTAKNTAMQTLQDDIAKEEKLVKEATIQKDVFSHMMKRLADDALDSRRDSVKIEEALKNVDKEIHAVTLQLQTAKQESKHEETKLNKLAAQVAARRKMQESRLDGINRVLAERSSLVEKQEERVRMREAVAARSKFDLGAQEEQRLKRMHVIRKVYSSMLEKKITAEEESLGALETTFQKIKIVTGLSDVDEIVQKFKERTAKTSQLHAHADEIRTRIDALREDNTKRREKLMRSATEASSGAREMYREMDTFTKGLGKAVKDCEDARDRAIRSNVTLEQLKLAVARFRSKVEGREYPPPTNDQLPEYLRELDGRLTGMMKSVSEALALDDAGASSSTKEGKKQAEDADSVKSGGGGGEVLLPFGKLQSEKLQKMLYHKLMLTNPDQGPRNVRVRAKPGLADLERYNQRKLMTAGLYEDPPGIIEDDVSEFAAPTNGDRTGTSGTAVETEPQEKEGFVDRDTVKRLSTLIVNREEPKKRRGLTV